MIKACLAAAARLENVRPEKNLEGLRYFMIDTH